MMNSSNQPSSSGSPIVHWPHPIRAVALDMDGLMLNTEDLYLEAISEILAKRGKQFRHEVRRNMMGQSAEKAWNVLIEAEELPVSWTALHKECEEIFEDLLPRKVATMPGVDSLLDLLDQHSIPRCIATSSVRAFASRALGHCGILDRLGFIVTSEDVVNGKPSPDIYQLAASRLGVQTHQMLVLEDSGNGAKAGVSSGACVIAVPTPHSHDHDFHGTVAQATSLIDPIIAQLLSSFNSNTVPFSFNDKPKAKA